MTRLICALAVIGLLAMTVLTQQKTITPELLRLANAERAFAKMAVDKGVREAFYNNFAEDGINFQPHPTNTREAYRKTPAPATPPPITLNWAPIYGDIAESGELGYTTGPYTVEDRSPAKRPTRHGMYSSVWKKQADGSWKVVLDLGIQLDSPVAPLDAPFQAAPQWKVKRAYKSDEAIQAELLATERAFFKQASGGASHAWQKYLSETARIHRNHILPVIGKAALQDWIGKQSAALSGEPIKAEVARSGDFGYSYGSYEWRGAKPEKGYYARVWKRDERGEWRIVFDVTAPLPEEK